MKFIQLLWQRSGIYDDGYVRRDDGGALTSDWGYNTALQYDSSAETLTMHRPQRSARPARQTFMIRRNRRGSGVCGTLWRGERPGSAGTGLRLFAHKNFRQEYFVRHSQPFSVHVRRERLNIGATTYSPPQDTKGRRIPQAR